MIPVKEKLRHTAVIATEVALVVGAVFATAALTGLAASRTHIVAGRDIPVPGPAVTVTTSGPSPRPTATRINSGSRTGAAVALTPGASRKPEPVPSGNRGGPTTPPGQPTPPPPTTPPPTTPPPCPDCAAPALIAVRVPFGMLPSDAVRVGGLLTVGGTGK